MTKTTSTENAGLDEAVASDRKQPDALVPGAFSAPTPASATQQAGVSELPPPKEGISDAVLAAAYQVAARRAANEQTTLWQQISFFVGANGAALAALAGLVKDRLFLGVVAAVGLAVSMIWFLSMWRGWANFALSNAILRKQEKRLGLGDFGPYTLGQHVRHRRQEVDGEAFRMWWVQLNGRNVGSSTFILVGVAYAVLLIKAIVGV